MTPVEETLEIEDARRCLAQEYVARLNKGLGTWASKFRSLDNVLRYIERELGDPEIVLEAEEAVYNGGWAPPSSESSLKIA